MSDTEFATASPRRSILFVALSPDESDAVATALKIKSRRWRLEFASTTTEALRKLRIAPFDCVVMNLQARGIDPHRFFKEVMESSPEALRVGLSGSAEREAIQLVGAPVHQFLARPLDPMVLTAVLARAFAAQDFLSQEHFRKLVDRITTLPTLPEAYVALLDELEREEPSMERLGDLVATDLALSARVLQLVNSPFFGLTRTIRHPTEAATFLGSETIKALVLSTSVFSQFTSIRLQTFSPEALWRHSWTTATLARRICEYEEAERSVADEAFLAGLLHDMGKLVLAANYPDLLEQCASEAEAKNIGFWEQEFKSYGASHAELGGYLLRRWGLPASVVDAVTFHHRPTLARIRTFAAVTAVHVANGLTHALSAGAGDAIRNSDEAAVDRAVDRHYLRTLGLEDRLGEWRELVAAELQRAEIAVSP